MEEDGFDMPDLSNQTTKTFQIQSLREVRTAAAAVFKVLRKEGECLRKLFPNYNMNRGYIFNMDLDLCNVPPPPPAPPSPSNGISRSNNNVG